MSFYRTLVALWLLGLLVITLGLAHERIVIVQHNWSMNDWLINYSAGFVRRGLLGEVILKLPFAPEWSVFTLIGSATAIYLHSVYRLATSGPITLTHLLLLACPALYFFPITDTDGAFRKEILFYAFYAVLLLQTLNKRPLWPVFLFLPVIILSHEALFAFLPAVLLPLSLADLSKKELAFIAVSILVSILGFTLSITTDISPQQVSEICAAIVEKDSIRSTIHACSNDGAISWLSKGVDFGRERVALRSPEYLPDLPWLLALLAIPLVTGTGIMAQFARSHKTGFIAFLAGLAVTLILWIPLFFVAVDWGRWLSMMLSILALQLYFMSALTPQSRTKWWSIGLAIILVPLYATSWQLGHWGDILRPGLTTPYIADFSTSP